MGQFLKNITYLDELYNTDDISKYDHKLILKCMHGVIDLHYQPVISIAEGDIVFCYTRNDMILEFIISGDEIRMCFTEGNDQKRNTHTLVDSFSHMNEIVINFLENTV